MIKWADVPPKSDVAYPLFVAVVTYEHASVNLRSPYQFFGLTNFINGCRVVYIVVQIMLPSLVVRGSTMEAVLG